MYSAMKKIQEKPPKGAKTEIWGLHAVREAWQNPARDVRALYITEQALRHFTLSAPVKRPPPSLVTRRELDRMTGGAVHQGMMALAAPLEEVFVQDMVIRAAQTEDKRAFVVVLDQVTDPHNVGAIMRSACAFGAAGMIMQRKHSPALTGVLTKTACGAIEHLPCAYEINLADTVEILRGGGFTVIGLDERGEEPIGVTARREQNGGHVALVLGAEGKGLRPKVAAHCDVLTRLPTRPPIESLNVSNAAAVALYAVTSQDE